MLGQILYLSCCIGASLGFMFDDPCSIMPMMGIPDREDSTINVTVPKDCRNGTFDWNYPRGHVLLTFQNHEMVEESVCIRDYLGGTVFTFTDTGSHLKLGAFNRTQWACTDPSNAREVVLRIDAPDTMYYMGAVDYKIQL